MEVQVHMETRVCVNCGLKFRVMSSSGQRVCSRACDKFGTREHGAAKRPPSAIAPKVESVTVTINKPTRNIAGKRPPPVDVTEWPTRKGKGSTPRNTTATTANGSTPSELNEQEKTENNTVKLGVIGAEETERSKMQKSTPEGTPETLPVLSGASVKALETESLTSMSLLAKSSNRLMTIMQDCVSDSDLEKSAEGTQRLELHRIEVAIKCANAITQNIQTQVNIANVMAKFMGGN